MAIMKLKRYITIDGQRFPLLFLRFGRLGTVGPREPVKGHRHDRWSIDFLTKNSQQASVM